MDIFSETLTRLNVSGGPLMCVFTPLKGMSQVVKRFFLDRSDARTVITMTLDDATFYSDERKHAIIEQYPEHELPARTKGIPTMGSGAVFPIDIDKLLIDPFEYPSHYLRVGGIDFGWHHPSAFAEVWWNRDDDAAYVVRVIRLRHQTPLQQVEVVRQQMRDLPWMWPRDGRQQTLAGAGESLAVQYRDCGLDLHHEPVTFPDGGVSVEAGLQMMLDRMRTQRLRVFRGQCDPFLEEARLFHRDEDGLLVKEGDDAISAVRYALMGLRHGRVRWSKGFFSQQWKPPIQSFA